MPSVRRALRLPLLAIGGTAVVWTAGAALASTAHAVPAFPGNRTIQQPDGVTFRGHQFGDEWANGVETADGYTVLRDARGVWHYATRDREGRLGHSSRRPGHESPPYGTAKHLREVDGLPPRRARARHGRSPGRPSRTPSAGLAPRALTRPRCSRSAASSRRPAGRVVPART